MAKETVQEKGQRLYKAGAVAKVGGGKYRVKGSSGEYTVWDGRCDCPAYSRCSHAVAVDLYEEHQEGGEHDDRFYPDSLLPRIEGLTYEEARDEIFG